MIIEFIVEWGSVVTKGSGGNKAEQLIYMNISFLFLISAMKEG